MAACVASAVFALWVASIADATAPIAEREVCWSPSVRVEAMSCGFCSLAAIVWALLLWSPSGAASAARVDNACEVRTVRDSGGVCFSHHSMRVAAAFARCCNLQVVELGRSYCTCSRVTKALYWAKPRPYLRMAACAVLRSDWDEASNARKA
eukprot:6456682-Amphidinium_carterae.2